jgi:hypothetical protein
MNKKYLDNLDKAKESLHIWFSNIEQNNIGNQMFFNENDLDRNKTDFAKWYFGEGQTFSSFESFRAIELLYFEMYEYFLKYNALYKEPIKKGFFTKKSKKRNSNLNVVFFEIQTSFFNLIKQLIIFQNRLLESPLFNSSNLESKINNSPLDQQKEIFMAKKDEKQTISLKNDKEKEADNLIPKTLKSNNKQNPAIDLNEEIRRILN